MGNDKQKRNGVTVIVRWNAAQIIRGRKSKSDQILSVRFQGKPSSHSHNSSLLTKYKWWEEITSFYVSVQDKLALIPNQHMVMIIGDWNAKIENNAESNTLRKFGPRAQHELGKQLTEFCEDNIINWEHVSGNQTDDWLHGHHCKANTELK